MRSLALALLLLLAAVVFADKPIHPSRATCTRTGRGRRSHRRHRPQRRNRPGRPERRSRCRQRTRSGDGSFRLTAPHSGSYTLVVSEPGFETVRNSRRLAPPAVSAAAGATAQALAAPLRIVLPIAGLATNVRVNADSSEDLTAPEEQPRLLRHDRRRPEVVAHLRQRLRHRHERVPRRQRHGHRRLRPHRRWRRGQPRHRLRLGRAGGPHQPGSLLGAVLLARPRPDGDHHQVRRRPLPRPVQLLLPRLGHERAERARPSKPFEQRRIYEGSATGPIRFAPKSSFLATFNRAEEDLDSVVSATCAHPCQSHRPLPGQRARAHPRHRIQPARRAPVRRAPLRLRAIQLSRIGPGRIRASAGKRWPPPATTTSTTKTTS